MTDLESGVAFLLGQSTTSIVYVFWYTLLFDVPRYMSGFIAIALAAAWTRQEVTPTPPPARAFKVSILVVGHDEAHALDRCVRTLREQTLKGLEIIIVSDGSSDAMARQAAAMARDGIIEGAMATDLRAGKSAGVNLAITAATGDIVVIVDCDCSYDRSAIENIVAPFADLEVGAVAGDLVPRNADASLVARFQAIEYLLAITAGKRIGAAIDQVCCVSGAFGAFRRQALIGVGGCDVGGGEDLDLTIRLRAAGWRVAFADDAVCYTDVPVTLWKLVRQRLRWDRDAIRLRYRKFLGLMNARSGRFRLSELFHQWEFLIFNVAATAIFPVYTVWLFTQYGSFAVPILVAMQLGLLLLDFLTLALASLVTDRPVFLCNVLHMPGYCVFNTFVMRSVRLWAYVEEWLLFGSIRDDYIPHKVRSIRKW
jgi:cellulose synthase/poly-beta-1,6-N-acetylglucosamine synthase-like glycosyltransferase